jgi:GTP-binding protein EngB required for normal cell division
LTGRSTGDPTIHEASALAESSPYSRLSIELLQAAERLATWGSEFAVRGDKLLALRKRLAQERFHLAVLGQFKRGKSTLINALLGEPVLPTGVLPLTSVPTFLLPGTDRRVLVHYRSGRSPEELAAFDGDGVGELLAGYVTEEANPRNHLGVSHVEVFHPARLLGDGVILIDTPGIGSTHLHNTEATLGFLSQCDAALFVLSPDPPITQVEVEFLREVRSRVVRVFFVFNKVDYLGELEKQAALGFLNKVLREQVGIEERATIFCASATRALEATRAGDSARAIQSGVVEIESHLLDFARREKTGALREAVARKARGVLADVALELRLLLRSQEMPLESLEERLRILEQNLEEARQQKIVATDLLEGERRRLEQFLEEQAERLRREASRRLGAIVEECASPAQGKAVEESAVREAMAEAIPAFFDRELGELTRLFESRIEEALRRHQQRADQLAGAVRRSAAELFAVPFQAPAGAATLELSRRPYWVTQQWESSLSPLPEGWLDRFLPGSVRRSRLLARWTAKVNSLVLRNVENLRWALLQDLDQSFRRFALGLDENLQEIIAGTHGALQAAAVRRKERAETTEPEIARLSSALAELAGIEAKWASQQGA